MKDKYMLNSGGPSMEAEYYTTLNSEEAVLCKWTDSHGTENAAVFRRACLKKL